MNHSCTPNVAVIFDGPKISLRSLTTIRGGDQLCISYVESTDPYHRRQDLLADRYFFRCECVKCQDGPTRREDRFLENPEDFLSFLALEDHLFELFESVEKEEGDSKQQQSPLPSKVARLSQAVSELTASRIWPIDRQPWPSIRLSQVANHIDCAQWVWALPHLLKTYFFIDPILYSLPWHPVRVVHTWTLTLLISHIGTMASSSNTESSSATKRQPPLAAVDMDYRHIDYDLILGALTLELEKNIVKSHGSANRLTLEVMAFARALRMQRGNLPQPHQSSSSLSAKDEGMAVLDVGLLEREWLKLRLVADTADSTHDE